MNNLKYDNRYIKFLKKLDKIDAKKKYLKNLDFVLSILQDNDCEHMLKQYNQQPYRFHKLIGKVFGYNNVYSISLADDLRLLFTYVENDILLIAIGSHNTLYS